MGATFEVDDVTYRSLEFAARIAGTTPGQVVSRLVTQASVPTPTKSDSGTGDPELVAIYADYDGTRTQGTYNRTTKAVEITSGPLSGTRYKTPTGAARAVVAHYKPSVNSNRNGWGFWTVDDPSCEPLQSIRYS